MADLLKKALLTDFKVAVDGNLTFNDRQKRNAAYRHINKLIEGPSSGKRRGLPNCVVAGIRGFMYGDGTRCGFIGNPIAHPGPSTDGDDDALPDISVSAAVSED